MFLLGFIWAACSRFVLGIKVRYLLQVIVAASEGVTDVATGQGNSAELTVPGDQQVTSHPEASVATSNPSSVPPVFVPSTPHGSTATAHSGMTISTTQAAFGTVSAQGPVKIHVKPRSSSTSRVGSGDVSTSTASLTHAPDTSGTPSKALTTQISHSSGQCAVPETTRSAKTSTNSSKTLVSGSSGTRPKTPPPVSVPVIRSTGPAATTTVKSGKTPVMSATSSPPAPLPTLLDLMNQGDGAAGRVIRVMLWAAYREVQHSNVLPLRSQPPVEEMVDLEPASCYLTTGQLLAKELHAGGMELIKAGCPFSLQLVTIRYQGMPSVAVMAWVPGVPGCYRFLLQTLSLASLYDSCGFVASAANEQALLETYVSDLLTRLGVSPAGLVNVACSLVPHAWSVYSLQGLSPSLSLTAIIPNVLDGARFTHWLSGLFTGPVKLVEELHTLAREDPYFEQVLETFGYRFGNLPARESWMFLPNMSEALHCIEGHLDSLVQVLRGGLRQLGAVSTDDPLREVYQRREELAVTLERAGFISEIRLLMAVVRPMGEAMRAAACAADLPALVASVLDYVNHARDVIYGEGLHTVPLFCWEALYHSDGLPLVYPFSTEPLDSLRGVVATRLESTDLDLARSVRDATSSLLFEWMRQWQPLLTSRVAQGAMLPLIAVEEVRARLSAVLEWVGLMTQTPVDRADLLGRDVSLHRATGTLGDLWRQGAIHMKTALGTGMAMILLSHK